MNNTYCFCKNCLFFDNCDGRAVCEHYAPLYEQSDDAIQVDIERDRDEYRSAWFEYIEKFND